MKNINALKIPKIKIKLQAVLWVLFVFVVLYEIYFLYTSLFAMIKTSNNPSLQVTAPSRGLNTILYEQATQWLGDRENFKVTPYSFERGTSGRANPMAQY